MRAFLKNFSKAQLTALLATVVDYGTLVVSVELFKVYYVTATAIGACFGAITNYIANRKWAFRVKNHHPVTTEFTRYTFVSAGSLGLNTLGIYILTEFLKPPYFINKIIIAIAVALIWNYPLHRFFVFREVR